MSLKPETQSQQENSSRLWSQILGRCCGFTSGDPLHKVVVEMSAHWFLVTISQGGLNFSLFPKQPQEQCFSNLNQDSDTLSGGGRSSARAAAVKRASEAGELASG